MLKLKKIIPEKWDNKLMDAPYSPSINFDDKQVPEIKDWQVGETYTLILEIKQTSKNENKDGSVNAGFDILAYKELNDGEYTDAEIEAMQGKALSGK